jgi:hypothetical protein
MKRLILLSSILILSGCSSLGLGNNDGYRAYLDTQKAAINANAMNEAARLQSLTEIAKTGNDIVKLNAIQAINADSREIGRFEALIEISKNSSNDVKQSIVNNLGPTPKSLISPP